MGNEMGNQNITALQEEENTAVEAPEKSLQVEAVLADEVKGENQIVPATENREVNEKVGEFSSDDPLEAADPRVDKQTHDGREQGDTELKSPQTPDQVPIELNDEASPASEIQTTSSSKDAEDNEKSSESNLDENLLETSDHRKQKQPSIRTETEEGERSDSTIDMISMDQKPDENELAKVRAEPQVEEGSCWPQDKEEVLGTSMSCDNEEKGHLLETEATISLAGIVASDTDLDKEKINADLLVKETPFEEEKSVVCEIISEDEVGNGLSNKTTVISTSHGDFGNKYDGEMPTEMFLGRNGSSRSQSEAISQSNSFHEVRELSSDDPLGAAHPRLDKQTSDGREQADTELLPQTPQVPIESSDEVSQASGIQTTSSKDAEEEENTAVEAPEKSLQEAVLADEVRGENQIVPATENREVNEKVRELSSDDPLEAADPRVDKQTHDGREQGDTKLKSPQTPDQVPIELNDEASQASGIQTSSSSKDAEDNEKSIESNLDENLSETSDHRKQKQPSIRIEEGERSDSTVDTISMDQKLDQHELAESQVEEGSCWAQDKNEEVVLGTSMSCDDEEKGHLLETEVTISQAGIVASDTDPDIEKINDDLLVKEMPFEEEKSADASICEEKHEIISEDEVGNGLSNKTTVTLTSHGGFGNKDDGELPTQIILSRNGSSKSQSEAISQSNSFHEVVPELHDKCVVLTEEAKLIGSGSVDEDECDPNPIQFNEQSMEDLKIEKLDASQCSSSLVGPNSDSGRENEDNYDPNPIQLYEQALNELQANKIDASQSDSLLVGSNSDNGSENEDKCDPNPMSDLEDEKMDASQFDLLLVGSNCDSGVEDEEKYDPNSIQFSEQAMNELETEKMDASQSGSTLIWSDHDNTRREILADSSCMLGIGDSQIKEEEVAENGYQSDFCDDKLNSASDQQLKDSEEEIELVPEIGIPTELTVTDHKQDEEQPAENEIINEKEEKAENSERNGSDGEESKAIEQNVSPPHPAEGTASLLSPCPCSPLQSQDHKDIVEKRTLSIKDLKQESCSEFSVTKASIVDCTNSTEKILISEVELAKEEFSVTKASIVDCTNSTEKILISEVELAKEEAGQDLPQYYIRTPDAETETLVNQSTKTFENVGCGAQERMGRLSIESNPEIPSIHIEPRKSPSFDFDLSHGARCEESDQTPLLHHDKIATRRFLSQDCVNFGNTTTKAEYSGDLPKYQAMPVEEKTIKMEKSDSEKSRTPFLSLLKGDEQANVVVSPKKQDSHVSDKKAAKKPCNLLTKEVTITSSKGSGKRKLKPSIFSTCLCCAASIH